MSTMHHEDQGKPLRTYQRRRHQVKKPSRMSSSKNFDQLWRQGIKELKETMLLIQNKILDKLTTIEHKLN